MTTLPNDTSDLLLLQNLKEYIAPDAKRIKGSLGTDALSLELAQSLLCRAAGSIIPRDDGGALTVAGEAGAACLASSVYVYDDEELNSISTRCFVDGNSLWVSNQELMRQAKDINAASDWMRSGAITCAKLALGLETENGEWLAVDPGRVQSALARNQHAKRLGAILAHSPRENAWRYASSMLNFAESPNGELTQAAKNVEKVPLVSGWANSDWQIILDTSSDQALALRDWNLQKNMKSASRAMSDMFHDAAAVTTQIKIGFLIMSQLTRGRYDRDEITQAVNGIVANPKCTTEGRSAIISIASIYLANTVRRQAHINNEGGWRQLFDSKVEASKVAQLMLQSDLPGQDGLKAAVVSYCLGSKIKIETPDNADTRVALHDWMCRLLSSTNSLPAEAIQVIAENTPEVLAEWICKNPKHSTLPSAHKEGSKSVLDSMIGNITTLRLWISRQGSKRVAKDLISIVKTTPLGHRFTVDTSVFFGLFTEAYKHSSLEDPLRLIAQRDPNWANRMLWSFARGDLFLLGPETNAKMIKMFVEEGADPVFRCQETEFNGQSSFKSTLELGQTHPYLEARVQFRRLAQQYSEGGRVVCFPSVRIKR